MYPKDYLERLAKDCAFEYDPVWWGKQKHEHAKDPENGSIVAFYKGRSIYNGVVALWGRDGYHAVLFYATPHDVADEAKYGWIPPVFRFETNQRNCYVVPKKPKPLDPNAEPNELEQPVEAIAEDRVLWRRVMNEIARPDMIINHEVQDANRR